MQYTRGRPFSEGGGDVTVVVRPTMQGSRDVATPISLHTFPIRIASFLLRFRIVKIDQPNLLVLGP